MPLHPDFRDLLAAFVAHDVDYLIVGGYAGVSHPFSVHKRVAFLVDWRGPWDASCGGRRAHEKPPLVMGSGIGSCIRLWRRLGTFGFG
jgi:hypothetical protein